VFALVVQTFLSAHELSLCLHSSTAVFDKCCMTAAAVGGVKKYSLVYGAFYQLLNSMLVHRTDCMLHLVPVFTAAIKRILVSLTLHMYVLILTVEMGKVICCLIDSSEVTGFLLRSIDVQ